jgi:hypothetical protein
MIIPTLKRTEGRAPVRGSEFTTKAATLQGDSAAIAPALNLKLWDPVVTGDWRLRRVTGFLAHSPFRIFLNLRGKF